MTRITGIQEEGTWTKIRTGFLCVACGHTMIPNAVSCWLRTQSKQWIWCYTPSCKEHILLVSPFFLLTAFQSWDWCSFQLVEEHLWFVWRVNVQHVFMIIYLSFVTRNKHPYLFLGKSWVLNTRTLWRRNMYPMLCGCAWNEHKTCYHSCMLYVFSVVWWVH